MENVWQQVEMLLLSVSILVVGGVALAAMDTSCTRAGVTTRRALLGKPYALTPLQGYVIHLRQDTSFLPEQLVLRTLL